MVSSSANGICILQTAKPFGRMHMTMEDFLHQVASAFPLCGHLWAADRVLRLYEYGLLHNRMTIEHAMRVL